MPPALPSAQEVSHAVPLLSLACFCSMATQRLCDAMLPALALEFDASLARTAQVVSLFAVVYGLAQLACGWLGDRHGKWRVLSAATLACALGSLAAAAATSLWALVFARMGVALFAAAVIPLALAWTGDAVAYAQRQETLARVGLGTTLGLVSGQVMGGVFADTLGWRWAFVLMAALFLVVGLKLRRHPQHAQPEAQARLPVWQQAREILATGWARRLLAATVVQGAAGFGMVALIASHLHAVHGLSLATAGGIVALFGLGGMAYMGLARHLIARLGEPGMALAGGLAMGTAVLTVAWAPSWLAAPPAMLLGGFGFFMLHNTLQANATQLAPQARGLGVSLFATALFLGQALGVLLGATGVERLGSAPVLTTGALLLAGMATLLSDQLRQRRLA